MDAFNDPRVETIVVQKAARAGGTEVINNIIGYCIDYDPCPILYVQTSESEGKKYSRNILKPMLEETPVLIGKMNLSTSEIERNTILHKDYPGGNLTIIGGQSPKGFRMLAKRVVICDDVDGMKGDVGGEGDPIKLAKRRASTYPPGQRKLIIISTPTIKGLSRIEREMVGSDYRKYHVPCPECGALQTLEWGYLKWNREDLPASVHYECAYCKAKIKNYQKLDMLRKGEWIAAEEFHGKAGFFLNGLYSTFIPWEDAVNDFLGSKDSPPELKVFVNTFLAETWEDEAESVSYAPLLERREVEAVEIPAGVLALTCGVDVQGDRIEGEIVGWGEGDESWGIEYFIIRGDPSQPAVWQELDEARIKKDFNQAGKKMPILMTLIDSGGHHTDRVYQFVRSKQVRKPWRVRAAKGSNIYGKPIIGEISKTEVMRKRKVFLHIIGTDTAKAHIYGLLKISEPGPGFCHFPKTYDDEFFRQLTAEKIVTKYERGFKKRVWQKKPGDRNEALDCRVYALAAWRLVRPAGMQRAKTTTRYGRRVISKGVAHES